MASAVFKLIGQYIHGTLLPSLDFFLKKFTEHLTYFPCDKK